MSNDEKQDLDLKDDENKDVTSQDADQQQDDGQTDDQQQDDAQNDSDGQEDYRGKLNAQNRFLEKEGYEFKDGRWQKRPHTPKPDTKPDAPSQQLSPRDAVLLAKADVDSEDVDEVLGYATYRKLPLEKALKDKTLQTILAERKEERSTANATNTGNRGRGASRQTAEQLVSNAKKGNFPESDEDLQRLVEAELEQKGKK